MSGHHHLPRRDFLRFAALGGAMLVAPRMALAAVETDRRFVFIIQRGAADGLNIVVPYGDPDYAKLRGGLAIDPARTNRLDGHFALHPALERVAGLYADRQAIFVHATASPYRDRSHFDGQNVLETGGALPYEVRDGWLNRLVGLLPRARDEAIAFAPTVPPALRGRVEVASYAPSSLPQASDDLLLRVGRLYQNDPQLHALWDAAREARGMVPDENAGRAPADLGRLAATFLTRPDGPRIAMLETGGWDTHSGQDYRLTAQLKALDQMVGALRDGLGDAWADTVVVVATEFGRTAAANGTGGTDHGTGSAAMLFGGGLKGGRVIADWPGLAQAQLYQGRDLKPTTGLDGVIAGLAAETFAIEPERVQRALFAQASTTRPLEGLIRSV
ncbi:DUF1501 domain-containing protein [Sphingomonas sp.]|uniref:DUF1501 domain-containing protein n=1 Tax=Sphingomonas sp. TaxID=28214 RepID=UPI000DB5FBC2|nr:DUF1501 domain-containing protein [Sphingomonas sp.]PZU07212.1 MAG: hypothetical protein DI605_16265 [Sphingomonas sp.]